MFTSLSDVVPAVLRATAAFSLSAGVVWGLVRWFKPASPRVQQVAWLLVLLQGIVLFRFPVRIPSDTADVAIAASSARTAKLAIASNVNSRNNSLPAAAPSQPSASTPIAWQPIVFGIWLTGCAARLGWWATVYFRVARQGTGSQTPSTNWAAEWQCVLAQNGTTAPIHLRVTHDRGPILIWRPGGAEVLIPRTLWERLSSPERLAILRHELAHFRHGDLWKGALIRLLALPHWFNPLAWWVVKNLDECAEWLCDDEAVGPNRDVATAYAEVLLRLGSETPIASASATAMRGGRLHSRIRRVLTRETRESSTMNKLLLAAVPLALLVAHLFRVQLVAAHPAPDTVGTTETTPGTAATRLSDRTPPAAVAGDLADEKVAENAPAPALRARLAEDARAAANYAVMVLLLDAVTVRQRLETRLRQKIAIVDWVCRLTDNQKQDLELAGHGDNKRLMDRIEEIGTRLQLVKNDSGKIVELRKEAEPLLDVMPAFSDADSFFVKVLEKRLTAEQIAKYEPLRAVSRAGGLVQTRRFDSKGLELNLNGTDFADDGLARLEGLTCLEELKLDKTSVTDVGLVHLKGMAKLQWLWLNNTQVTNVGLAHLKGLTELQVLALDNTKVTDEGLANLKGMTKLGGLLLTNTQVTDEGLYHFEGANEFEQSLACQDEGDRSGSCRAKARVAKAHDQPLTQRRFSIPSGGGILTACRSLLASAFIILKKGLAMNRIGLSIVLVGLGVATGLLVSSGLAEPTAVVRGPNAENLTALRKERRDILRQAVKQTEVLYRAGNVEYESVSRITIKLLNAELDLAPDRAGRIALREQTVEKFKEFEKFVAARVEAARAQRTDHLEVKAARLQAEIDLLLETADGK